MEHASLASLVAPPDKGWSDSDNVLRFKKGSCSHIACAKVAYGIFHQVCSYPNLFQGTAVSTVLFHPVLITFQTDMQCVPHGGKFPEGLADDLGWLPLVSMILYMASFAVGKMHATALPDYVTYKTGQTEVHESEALTDDSCDWQVLDLFPGLLWLKSFCQKHSPWLPH